MSDLRQGENISKGNASISQKRLIHRGILGLLFTVYMFEFTVTLSIFSKDFLKDLSVSISPYFISLNQIIAGLGLILFGVIRHFLKARTQRKMQIIIANTLYALTLLYTFIFKNSPAYFIVILFCDLFMGMLGGVVFYVLSQALSGSRALGKIVAVGGFTHVMLQFLFQETIGIKWLLIILLIISSSLVTYMSIYKPWDFITDDTMPDEPEDVKLNRSKMGKITLITLAMTAIGIISIASLFVKNISTGSENYNWYGWPRLLTGAGFLVVGMISDFRMRRYLPIAALISSIFCIMIPMMTFSEGYEDLCLSIMYFNKGATLTYMIIASWDIAPKLKYPYIYASLGYFIYLTIGEILDITLTNIMLKPVTYALISMLLCIAIIIIMAVQGDLSFNEPYFKSINKRNTNYLDFTERFSLTPKEKEVLYKLLTTELGLQEIADEMYISKRVLQRYITSIYQKTGAKSRIGLFCLYYDIYGESK